MSPSNEPPRRGNAPPPPPRNSVRSSRQSNRPKAFFWLLGVIALIGVAALGYVATKPKSSSVQAAETADTTNAGPSQAYVIGKVDAPKPCVMSLAFECGLDVAKWETFFDAWKYQKRISANLAEGLRRGVNSTPTFVIGSRMYPGMRTYDEVKRLVDSLAKPSGSSTASSTTATKPK